MSSSSPNAGSSQSCHHVISAVRSVDLQAGAPRQIPGHARRLQICTGLRPDLGSSPCSVKQALLQRSPLGQNVWLESLQEFHKLQQTAQEASPFTSPCLVWQATTRIAQMLRSQARESARG